MFAERGHKEKACFPFLSVSRICWPIEWRFHTDSSDGADAAEWEPCQDQRPQTVSPFILLLVSEGPPAARPLPHHLSVADVRSSPTGGRQVVQSDGQPSLLLRDRLNSDIHFPKKKEWGGVRGVSGFSAARLNTLYPSILPALVDSAHQAAADLI